VTSLKVVEPADTDTVLMSERKTRWTLKALKWYRKTDLYWRNDVEERCLLALIVDFVGFL
jgi:hypothetical protein